MVRRVPPDINSVEDLARIEKARGIEGTFDLLHHFETAVPHLLAEPLFFRQADAMLAGDRSAQLQRLLRNPRERVMDARHFILVAFVGEERGVQVAIAHVTERSDLKMCRARGL